MICLATITGIVRFYATISDCRIFCFKQDIIEQATALITRGTKILQTEINWDLCEKIDKYMNLPYDIYVLKSGDFYVGPVIMGILAIVTIFMPPIASVICLFGLIPYVIIGIVYGVVVGKR